MFEFLKRRAPNFRDQLKAINDIGESLRFYLYLGLKEEYEKEMEEDLTGLLAARVLNYLMGDDLEKVYEGVSPDVRKKSEAIKDLVGIKVEKAMMKNKLVRELIIRHIMTTYLIYHCVFDKNWFDKPEMKNRENLIKKYGSDGKEFLEVENFDRYMTFALNFIRVRQQLEEQRKRNLNNERTGGL